MSEEKIVHILWTGGLDSTCRVVELSRSPYIIQPHYIIDSRRPSTKYELAAMNSIKKMLLSDIKTKCKLLPTKCVKIDEISEDLEITDSWKRLHLIYKLGSQYDWLARYAKQNKIKLEIGLQFSQVGRVGKCLEDLSKFIVTKNDSYHVMQIDPDYSSKEVLNIFGNFIFPESLYHKSKMDELLLMREYTGNDNIAKKTWFCHDPILGFPCGHCHPCQDALHEGMAWRISKVGYILGGLRELPSLVYRHLSYRL